MEKHKCEHCKRQFPERLLHPFVTTKEMNTSIIVCPICAKALIRELHNLPHFTFRQPKNKQRYDEALEYVKSHYTEQSQS